MPLLTLTHTRTYGGYRLEVRGLLVYGLSKGVV